MPTSVDAALSRTLKHAAPPRHLLWIDGVGGFLLCHGPRVTLGHANAQPAPDVPLFADVSRLHAALQRDAEGYAFEAQRSARVNGHEVQRAILRSGDRITLGSSCQLLFLQSLPLSASARLDVVSGQRLGYPVTSVLLMADTLVFSGGTRGHVTITGLDQPIIVMRDKNGLALRHEGKIITEDTTVRGRAPLEPGRTVRVGEVSMMLEVV